MLDVVDGGAVEGVINPKKFWEEEEEKKEECKETMCCWLEMTMVPYY